MFYIKILLFASALTAVMSNPTQSPAGLPGLSLKHLFTLDCTVGTPIEIGDNGSGKQYTTCRASR